MATATQIRSTIQEKLPTLGGMGFSQVPAPEDSPEVITLKGDIKLSEFCAAFRHPLLRATLYISELDSNEWFVELDSLALIFRGNDELMLMDTLLHLMPAGAA